ncbi:hypothetical protein, partial [Streptomyces sp. NPDC048155]|uniref:hypothetical protein n=1 Tax=Streptomyces sp. NPDC048155 TaxID=3154818 RepID=UPI0033CE141A
QTSGHNLPSPAHPTPNRSKDRSQPTSVDQGLDAKVRCAGGAWKDQVNTSVEQKIRDGKWLILGTPVEMSGESSSLEILAELDATPEEAMSTFLAV